MTNQDAPQTPQEAPDTHRDTPARADHLTAVVVPLVAQIDALRQTVERQAEQLVSQGVTIGRLMAERDSAVEALRMTMVTENPPPSPPEAPREPQPVAPTTRTRGSRLCELAPWLLLGVILLLAFVVGQPAWVR